jgi:hypothetical protein
MDDGGRAGRLVRALLLAVLVLPAAGCTSGEEPAVEQVAAAFTDPDSDPAARCGLLSPGTAAALEEDEGAACADAVGQVPAGTGPVESVAVWGGEAQVRLAGDTLFLTSTPSGWRVTAADCRAAGEGPYHCRLEGP